MSAQAIARLEKLLGRVQERRDQPRALRAAPAATPADDAGSSSVDEVSDELAASEPPLALVSRVPDATLADDDLEVTTLPPSALESEPPDAEPELELDLEAERASADSELPIPTGVLEAPEPVAPEPEAQAAPEPEEAPEPEVSADEASFAGLASEPPTQPPSAPVPAAEVRPLTLAPEPEPDASETEEPPAASAEEASPAPSEVPASAAAEPLTEPTAQIDHVVPQASGPVAFEEGELPAPDVLTFEDLIARSLSLRARS